MQGLSNPSPLKPSRNKLADQFGLCQTAAPHPALWHYPCPYHPSPIPSPSLPSPSYASFPLFLPRPSRPCPSTICSFLSCPSLPALTLPCPTSKDAEQLSAVLSSKGLAAAYYHADMDPGDRQEAHMAWSRGDVQVGGGGVKGSWEHCCRGELLDRGLLTGDRQEARTAWSRGDVQVGGAGSACPCATEG